VGFTSDKGGNTIDVHWYTRKTVLHHVSPMFRLSIPLQKAFRLASHFPKEKKNQIKHGYDCDKIN
jgi:hypothetical protein